LKKEGGKKRAQIGVPAPAGRRNEKPHVAHALKPGGEALKRGKGKGPRVFLREHRFCGVDVEEFYSCCKRKKKREER